MGYLDGGMQVVCSFELKKCMLLTSLILLRVFLSLNRRKFKRKRYPRYTR
jgi:hypothetical protein